MENKRFKMVAKILSTVIFLAMGLTAFGQVGSLDQSVYRSKLPTGATAIHPSDRGALWYDPSYSLDDKWRIWSNGAEYPLRTFPLASFTNGNGTTFNTNKFDWGGALTGNVNIDGNYDLTFGGTTKISQFNLYADGGSGILGNARITNDGINVILHSSWTSLSPNVYGEAGANASGAYIRGYNTSTNKFSEVGTSASFEPYITNTINGKGIVYSQAPTALVTLSLIHKGYADATYAPISGGGYVTSVSGTTNRITSTGGTTPVVDISASYVGQSSITTLGTIGTGVWQGTAVGDSYISSATNWNTAYNRSGTSLTFTSSTFTFTKQDASTLTVSVPTFNQNTSGSAATLTTPRAIYGNNFDGSAALTQIIASTYGGTGNGFTKFTGPTSSEKTFTLPDANATLARSDAAQTFTGVQTFSSAPSFSILPTGAGVSLSATASTLAARDINSNIFANNLSLGYTTTTTAAGTTTLTINSTKYQYFTGSTTQTVVLPAVTTLWLGPVFEIYNKSSGTVTVQTSGSNTIQAMASGTSLVLRCISLSGTGTSSWDWDYTTQNPMTALGDLIIGGTVTNGIATPLRLGLGGANTVIHGGSTTPVYSAVIEGDFGFTDITTANVSISAHGLAPKLPNDATKFLDGTGAYSVPSGSGSWSLTSGGTALGVNTFTSNAKNQLIYTGTYITSADLDFYGKFNPIITGDGTVGHNLEILSITGSMTPGANSQIMTSLFINTTYSTGGFSSTQNKSILAKGGDITLQNSSGVQQFSIGANGLTTIGGQVNTYLAPISTTASVDATNGVGIRFSNSGFTTSSSSISAYNYQFKSNGVSTANSTSGSTSFLRGDLSFAASSTNTTFKAIDIAGTYNFTGSYAGNVYDLFIGVTETSMTGATHYGVASTSPTAVNLFGVSTGANASVVIAAGTTTLAPLKLISGTNLTSAVNGTFEYDGTTLFFTRASTTRESILTSAGGGAAPSTTATPTFTAYYGGNTNALGDPVGWAYVVINGTIRKIPYY